MPYENTTSDYYQAYFCYRTLAHDAGNANDGQILVLAAAANGGVPLDAPVVLSERAAAARLLSLSRLYGQTDACFAPSRE
jgi:hypothetical protein